MLKFWNCTATKFLTILRGTYNDNVIFTATKCEKFVVRGSSFRSLLVKNYDIHNEINGNITGILIEGVKCTHKISFVGNKDTGDPSTNQSVETIDLLASSGFGGNIVIERIISLIH